MLMSLQLDVAVTEPDAGHLLYCPTGVVRNDFALPRQDWTATGAAVAVAVVAAVSPPAVKAAAVRTRMVRERICMHPPLSEVMLC